MKGVMGLSVLLWVLMSGVQAAGDQQPPFNPQMSPEAMQEMMQKMEEMQRCMAQIDEVELKQLEQRSYQFEADVKSLCSADQRSAAQAKAVAFSREIKSSKALQKLQECAAGMQQTMAQMPFMQQLLGQTTDYASRHVCDHL